jgi:general secretion pathway protein D
VVVHNDTNQIVLQGYEEWVAEMAFAIRKLDRKPRQIFVDAIIAEISDQTTKRLGLQFSGSKGKLGVGNFTDNAGTNLSSLGGTGQLSSVTGGVIAIGPGATLVPNMGALLTALEADTQNRILATPSLMTTENSEASILVGQNVPFITGTTSSSGDNTISPFQTIQRQDLGTILKLKPRIGRNGEVVLSIRQEVSRIDNTTSGLSDVATVKREIDTVVSTESGQIIVIGGLRTKSLEKSKSQTPGLSEIPIFGVFFKQNGSKVIERSLAIFLKATVVTETNSKIRILENWEGEFNKSFDNLNSDKFDTKIILNDSDSRP